MKNTLIVFRGIKRKQEAYYTFFDNFGLTDKDLRLLLENSLLE